MTLDQMRYFMEVCYCRSFSQAAQNLYISQPNLTKYIASLEKELNTRLFDRTTRRVEITDAGERLRSRIEVVLMPMLRTMSDIQSEVSSNRQTVYIGVSRDENLPDAFLEILRRRNLPENSAWRYLVLQDSHVGLASGLRSQYDMVISSDRNIRTFAGLNYVTLQPFHMVMAVSRYHPLANKPDLCPADFREEPIFFSLPQGNSSTATVSRVIYYRLGGLVNIKLVPTPSDALRCVQLCAGAAIIPSLIDSSRFPDVRFLDFDEKKEDAPALQCAIWPAEATSPALLDLTSELESVFGPAGKGGSI